MYWESALIAVTVTTVVYILYTIVSRPKNFPPGPFPLPIIGSLHKLGDKPHIVWKELSRKYGDVFCTYLGNFPVVVVNSYKHAREVLIEKGTDFAGRPASITGAVATRGLQDIAYDDYGTRWKASRKIAHRALKLFGAGRLSAEKIITKHSQELLERLKERVNNGSFDPHHDFGLAVVNVICHIVFGSSYDDKDEEFLTILHYNKLQFAGLAGSSAVDFMPWLRFFPNKYLDMLKTSIKLRDPILEKWLKYHKETLVEGQPRDLTDALLEGAKEELSNNKSEERFFTDDHILMMMGDIFNAGFETVTTTLRWAVTYFVHWPKIQQKVHKELDFVIGRDRLTTLADTTSLPYLQATIHEIGRIASVVPFLVPHKTTCDTSAAGYDIPKNTHVFVNAYAIHHDEREWEKPEEFCPERWLDENGHFVPGKNKAYLPFSAGPRVCFGEALAKCELFLFLSHTLQMFSFEKAPGHELPKLEGHIGLTREPFPFQINIRKRF